MKCSHATSVSLLGIQMSAAGGSQLPEPDSEQTSFQQVLSWLEVGVLVLTSKSSNSASCMFLQCWCRVLYALHMLRKKPSMAHTVSCQDPLACDLDCAS